MGQYIHFQWASVPQFLVALFLLAQGLVVLIQKPKNRLHQAFFLFQLPIALWLVSMGLAYMQKDAALALLFSQLGFLGVMYIPVSTYAFSVFFLGDKNQLLFVYGGFLATSAFTLFISHGDFTAGLTHYGWGNYIRLGKLSVLAVILFALYTPLFIRNFYVKYKTSPPEQKRWHLSTLVMGSLAFLASIDFLPAYGIALPIPPVGYLFVGSFVTLMGYFMLRHHLSDLKIIAGKSVGYGILTVVLLLIYTSLFIVIFPMGDTFGESIAHAFLFVAGLYFISFVQRKSQRVVDEIFFKEKIDYQALVTGFNSELRNLADTKTLLSTFFKFLSDRLRIQKSYVCTYSDKEKSWMIYESSSKDLSHPAIKDLPLSENLKNYFFANPHIIDARDYVFHPILDSTRQETLDLIREYQGKILIPLLYRSIFFGFLILGDKDSQENYTHKEIEALKYLATPLSIAWDNAMVYENVQHTSQLKTDFVSIVSHQLRTPLSGLRWSLDLLRKKQVGSLNTEQMKMINDIFETTDKMIEIINQLLDIVYIEESKIKMEMQNIDAVKLIEDIVREKSSLIQKKNVEVSYRVSKNVREIRAHHDYTKTVLSILIDNALRYTKPGGKVSIQAFVKEGKAVVSVKDSGIGIPKKEQYNIFTKFYRASNAQLQEPNGSGLGLYYAKTLIEKQGGEIWFRSEENAGTTFYIALRK